jgi:glycosyltransferase involved in cell wall biosynthesis
MKKIMYVHYQLSALDGSNTHTSNFIRCFTDICTSKGVEFVVQAPTLDDTPPKLKSGVLSGFKSWLAKYYLRDFKVYLDNKKRYKKELELLKQERPDIVLSRFEKETVSIAWACKELNIPLVLELNSPDIEAVNAHYKSLPYFSSLFSTPYMLSIAKSAFTVTPFLTQSVLASINNKKNVVTIANGVDIDKFRADIEPQIIRKQFNIKPEDVVIGFVGSFAPWHGIDIIAQSFPYLKDKGYPVKLMLVGQVHQADADSWISKLLASEHKQDIIQTGFVPLTHIPEYLASMDITVLANTEDYCSPLKIFEYMAMAKGVVSVETEAVKSIMRPDVDGLVFPRGDVDEFSNQVEKLITKPELRQQLGNSAKERVAENFQWKHNAQAVFELLDNTFNQKLK